MYCSSAFMQKLSSAFILQRMIYNNGCRDQGLKNRYNRQRDSSLIYIVFSGLKTILNFIKLTVKQHFKLKISFISCNNKFFQDDQQRPPLRAHSETYRHSNLNKYIIQMYVTLTWDLAPVKNINNLFTLILFNLRQACKVLNILVRIPIDKPKESLSFSWTFFLQRLLLIRL